MSNQAAVTQAIQQWLERRVEAGAQEQLPENERWHGLLAEILASGDQEAIAAVRQNLLVFHRLMRSYRVSSDAAPVSEKRKPTD